MIDLKLNMILFLFFELNYSPAGLTPPADLGVVSVLVDGGFTALVPVGDEAVAVALDVVV